MLVELFYHIDNFCNILKTIQLPKKSKKLNRLTNSEIMTICVYYHYSGYKTFKDYYKKHVLIFLTNEFKNLVSYNRFVELKQELAPDIGCLMQMIMSFNQCTGTSFIDSFSLVVSHNKRIYSHKVFQGVAARGKTSVGWFFGFKVHITVDPAGNILNLYFTPGNIADNNEQVLKKLTANMFGKIFGDKGYLLNPELFRQLYENSVQFVTKIRSNMQNKLMNLTDKLLLKKRGVIESVIDIIKIHLSVDHSRHRSRAAFLSNLFSGIIAYAFYPQKPSIVANLQVIP